MTTLTALNALGVRSQPAVHDAASARVAIQHLQARLGAAAITGFRPPPPEPVTCCGRGCNGCVWEGFLAAVAWWCEEAALLLPAR